MPKIRALKPEFWTDKNIVRLTPHARLLFMGMWNHSADCGHIEDEPIELKMRILPADNCQVEELLDELVENGRIERKEGWITVLRFAEHQKIDKRYATYCEPCKSRREHAEQTPPQTPNHGVPTPGSRGDHDVTTAGSLDGGDGDGDVNSGGDGDRGAQKRATALPRDWQPTEAHSTFAAENLIDIKHEVEKFTSYNTAKGSKYKDWNAAFRNWLVKEAKWAAERAPRAVQPLRPVAEIEEPPDGLTDAEYREWFIKQRSAR